MCEVNLMIGGIVVGLYIVELVLGKGSAANTIIVHPIAALLAAASVAVSLWAFYGKTVDSIRIAAFTSYLLLLAGTGLLVISTGAVNSPFVVLWMLAAVFSGMLGNIAIISLLAVTGAYIAYMFATHPNQSVDQLFFYVIIAWLPLAISFAIWHGKKQTDNQKDRVYSALTKELTQVASKSEIVINAIADGVIAIDGGGNVQLINPAAQSIIGWGKDDALDLAYRSVIHLLDPNGNEIDNANDPVLKVLQTYENIVNNNYTLVTKSGKNISISLMVSPVSNGNDRGAIIVFRDISKQKTEEREEREFISTASHEMRTPIAAIEGYISLALNPTTANIDDKARVYINKAHESSQHLGRLFKDLLDVTKLEDGRMTQNPVVVDIVSQVQTVVEELSSRATEKDLQLLFGDTTVGQESPSLMNPAKRLTPVFYSLIDPVRLKEILSNLVDNAIKYTKAGSVMVDVSGDDKKVVVSIKDSGIGIPPEDIPHLFQKFYRVDSSDTREIGGTGLGLYLCRRLVEAMNGRIWVESAVGEGSTFFVEIPRLSNEEAQERLRRGEGEQSAADTPAAPAAAQPIPAASPLPPAPLKT
jgi:PAS domain S-box-containing protein